MGVHMSVLALNVKNKVWKFLFDEDGEVTIVTIVVLIGIAVLLAVTFRHNIESLLDTMFNTINNTSNDALKQ